MTSWTKEELLAYLLVWSAHADFNENTDEIELMSTKVSMDVLKKIEKEFMRDNDKQSIDKICDTFERLNYSSSELDQVFEDMKELFQIDGKMDILEGNLIRGLKHILR
jgi:hypothetical protein